MTHQMSLSYFEYNRALKLHHSHHKAQVCCYLYGWGQVSQVSSPLYPLPPDLSPRQKLKLSWERKWGPCSEVGILNLVQRRRWSGPSWREEPQVPCPINAQTNYLMMSLPKCFWAASWAGSEQLWLIGQSVSFRTNLLQFKSQPCHSTAEWP